MKIRTITSLREFDDLAKLWQEVAEASGHQSVLQSHDWFASCWRTAGPNRSRELWIVEDSAGPLALIPMVHGRGRYRGFPAQISQLMHPPDAPIADFPIVRDVEAVVRTFLAHLARRHSWDVFVLPGLPVHSAVWKALEPAVGSHFGWRVAERRHVPYIALSERDPSFEQAVGQLQRTVGSANHARYAISIEAHPDPDPHAPLFHELTGVVTSRARRAAAFPGPTADEVRRFFRSVAARPGLKGCLTVWVLRLDGRVAEVEYQVSSNGSIHAIRRDSDQSPAELRLGDTLTLAIVKDLARRQTAHTYYPVPAAGSNGIVGSSGHELLFVELLAARSYAALLHRLETHMASLTRRVARQEPPCA